jgi:hypothetical protein
VTRTLQRIATGLVLAVIAAACGQTSPSALPSTLPSTLPSAAGSAPSSSAASPTPEATVPTAVDATEEDESLLAVLPEDVAGTPVELEHQAFIDAASDPAFGASIETAAFFVAPGEGDIVSGLVARPRDGVYSEAWFIDWRETYEAGACAQADGVAGTAEAAIGGRPVSITTCAGGMRVYQAWVPEQQVVISLLALGDNRWGEQVMRTLRP